MRFLHVSDTHIGYAKFNRLTSDGLNQREADFFDAFRQAVDLAIAQRVDFVLHSGDLFDAVRPTNRAIAFVMSECVRLHVAGIPFVVIGGNHEAPRLRETGSVLRVIEHVPGVLAAYKGRTEGFRIGETAIHATPHADSSDALRAQLASIKPDPDARWNIATLHAGVLGVGDFTTGEFHELIVRENDLPANMDYTALGHYHTCTEVAPRVWYAGSTERADFGDWEGDKCVLLVDLASGAVTPHALRTRRLFWLEDLAAAGLRDSHIGPMLYERLEKADMSDAVVRLRVTGLPSHVYSTLDFARIKKLTQAALHFDLKCEIVRQQTEGAEVGSIGELADEFDAYLNAEVIEHDRDEISRLGRELLMAALAGAPGEANLDGRDEGDESADDGSSAAAGLEATP